MNRTENYGEYRNGSFHSIIEIDDFAKAVTSSGEPGFLVRKNEQRGIDLKTLWLGNYFQKINHYLSQFDNERFYSEHVQLFRDACTNLGITYGVLDANPHLFYWGCRKFGAEIFNDLLEEMRALSQTMAFKRKVYDRQYNGVRNYQSCVRYLDALFEKYSRLLVLRLDFGYRKAHGATIEEAQQDIEHYLNNRRGNRLFDSLVGYIIKLECTAEKGPHLHCFFFLNGAQAQQHVFLAQEYGNYWLRLTEGRGVFFNCNMKRDDYKYCAVGMIHHADVQMRGNLLVPLKYITKADQRVKMKTSAKARVFWRGEMPSVRSSNAGRPRKAAGESRALCSPM